MKRNNKTSHTIHNILQRTIIEPHEFMAMIMGQPEAIAKKLQPIQDYLRDNAPQRLFRLRKCSEDSFNALRNGNLYLTRADHFNDPFDCLLQFDRGKLFDYIDRQLTAQNLKEYLRSINVQFPLTDDVQTEEQFLEQCMNAKSTFLSSIESTFTNVTGILQRSTYIVSLTETLASPIMWSHYSDYHQGFAIAYEFESSYFEPSPHFPADDKFDGFGWRSLLPVYYSKYRADGIQLANWLCQCEMRKAVGQNEDWTWCIPDMLLKTKLSLTKSESWAYEKEWRIILTHEWPNEFGDPSIHFIQKAVGIYLGARIHEDDKAKLCAIAKEKGIPVYQMYIDHTSREYEMKYHEVLSAHEE